MKTCLMTSVALAVTLILAAPVLAAEATGTVKSVNVKKDAITLSDGKTFVLPEGMEAEALKVGEKVHVIYSTTNGKVKVTKIEPAM